MMHLPCFVYIVVVYKSNFLLMLLFDFAQVTILFWSWCPLAVLSTGAPAGAPAVHCGLLSRPSSTRTSPTALCPPTGTSLFLHQLYSLFSFNYYMYVFAEMKFDFLYYLAVI
jgi:hypothetical protein